MKRLRKTCAFLIIILLIFTGCAPHKDLKELSIVEGMGVDLNPDGSYLLTFQVFKPSSGGGGGGTQTSGTTTQTTIIQSSGKSLFDASRNATLQMGKKLYYSNVNALIFSRDICKSKLPVILDFFERNHEIMPNERVFMAEGRAEDILTAKNEDGYIPASKIELISENNVYTSEMVDQQLEDLLKIQNTGIKDFYLGILSVKKSLSSNNQQSSQSNSNNGNSSEENNIIVASGTAIFHDDKLVDTFDYKQTRGLLWIIGKVESGAIVVNLKEGGNASLEIKKSSSKISVSVKNGIPCINVDINVESSISEIESTDVTNIGSAFKDELVNHQNQTVKNEAESAIKIALKKDNSDIFGFGLKLFEYQPAIWHKLEENWSKNAGTIQVNINVNSTISHNGLITR